VPGLQESVLESATGDQVEGGSRDCVSIRRLRTVPLLRAKIHRKGAVEEAP
jgi:hypothetical protein